MAAASTAGPKLPSAIDDWSPSSYRIAMVRGTFRHRTIALIAAYALALQGLFAAFGPLAVASDTGILCSGLQAEGQAGSGPYGSAGHDKICLSACAMLGAADAPRSPEVCRPALSMQPVPPARPAAAAFVPVPRGPHAARAPPLV